MAVVTGNFQVDYVITVFVTYLVTSITMGLDLAKKFYTYYPDAAFGVAVVVGGISLIYVMRNIVSIVYGLIVTLIRITVILTIVAAGSWVYLRGFDKVQSDAKQLFNFIAHYNEHSFDEVKEYAASVKDNTSTLKQFIINQYQTQL